MAVLTIEGMAVVTFVADRLTVLLGDFDGGAKGQCPRSLGCLRVDHLASGVCRAIVVQTEADRDVNQLLI